MPSTHEATASSAKVAGTTPAQVSNGLGKATAYGSQLLDRG